MRVTYATASACYEQKTSFALAPALPASFALLSSPARLPAASLLVCSRTPLGGAYERLPAGAVPLLVRARAHRTHFRSFHSLRSFRFRSSMLLAAPAAATRRAR